LGVLPGQTYENLLLGTTTYTPAGQPYSIAPWNYPGTEGSLFDSGGNVANGKAGYPSTVVDWVLVSLRDKPDATGVTLCQAAALLHKDGHIEFVEQPMPAAENGDQHILHDLILPNDDFADLSL